MLAVSMRMTRTAYPNGGEELRDAMAHDWWRFFHVALPDIPVIPVPNIGEHVINFLQSFPITGIVLTGGDDWGEFPERDTTEKHLVFYSRQHSLPVLGICRGAQVLNLLMGGKLSKGFCETHVRTRHYVQLKKNTSAPYQNMNGFEVNSYHNYGIWPADLAPDLEALATAQDGSVEGFSDAYGRITGIMWHPERERVTQTHDIQLFQHCFMRIRQ